MQQKWWLIAAGVVGVGLAVLLFPRPDTGEDIPEANLANGDPLNFTDDGERKVLSRPGVPASQMAKREVRPPSERLGANPMAAVSAKRRATPEAAAAGRASGPWTIVRRQLILSEDEEGKALAEQIAPLITDLRAVRRNPEESDWPALVERQVAFAEQVRNNEVWMADEIVVQALDRVDAVLNDFEGTQSEGDAPE